MHKPWLTFYEKGVPSTLSYPNTPIDAILTAASRTYPQHTATNFVLKYLAGGRITIGGKLTYQHLNELVNRFATALHHLGVRKGDRVALMLPNSPHFVIAFFATLRLGGIVVTINPTYTSRELSHQIRDSGAETIILLNLFVPRLHEDNNKTDNKAVDDLSLPPLPLKRVIVAHISDTLPPIMQKLVVRSQQRDPNWVQVKDTHKVYFFSHLLEYAPHPPPSTVSPDDVALFQYTGGTTGTPKAAMLTHRNILANTTQTTAWLVDRKLGAEKVMAAIPFFHVYGLTVGMLQDIVVGGELVIIPNPRPIENVIKSIEKERCTIFPGVPAMYLGVINNPNINKYDLRSVRACLSGSAPLPREVQARFEQITGGYLVEGYGLTEAAPVTHCNPLRGFRKSGSIGVPMPDVEAKIVNLETGKDLAPGSDEVGEMYVRGPQVMQQYWQYRDETQATIDEHGWLHTGDICRMDADGFFYLVDRKKDMINVGGLKVLPRDVEEVLFMHPKVQEAVVVGVYHPARGDESVKAYIVPTPGDRPTQEDIRTFCSRYLAPHKIPREVECRSELPKTLVGKVLRRVLVEEEHTKILAVPVTEYALSSSCLLLQTLIV